MELVKEGDHILYVWGGEINSNIEEQVNKLKLIENVKVNVENAERLSLATYKNSIFDIILSNLSSNNIKHTDELLGNFIKLVKPKGVVAIQDESLANDEFISKLKLNGFINIKFLDNVFQCEKPNYEIGSSKKLSFTNKTNAVKSVWKIDNNDNDDDIIDPDELLDEDDLKKPNPTTLRVCGTTGKRKACKDCSCGLAEELDQENLTKSKVNETQKSSCGSCYLGDAFRCATCPYLGMPAFKPGEKIQLSDTQMKADI